MVKLSFSENTIYLRLVAIELFYFDDNFRPIAQWVLALSGNITYCSPHTFSLCFLHQYFKCNKININENIIGA